MKRFLLATFLMGWAVSLMAQHAVSGTVKDADGEALIGVNIAEKGTTTGGVTDMDGRYSFNVSGPTATLVFSYTGFETRTITLSGQSVLDVIMSEGVVLGEVQVVGSRSYKRSVTDSPAPVDVIDIGNLANTTGRTDVNQIMQYAAPSFNATKQSGSDGADHIDPASLRGLGPDQTLVLVNGKRRHQSSLVISSAPEVAAIPAQTSMLSRQQRSNGSKYYAMGLPPSMDLMPSPVSLISSSRIRPMASVAA